MLINQVWDYPSIDRCAVALDALRDESNANKAAMDRAIELLTVGAQAEVGSAFAMAYADNVASIVMFAQVLGAEAELLRANSNTMQETDAQLAEQIRQLFAR